MKSGDEGAWTHITARDSLAISYIFYGEADNQNNGVVLRLRNRNDHSVRYSFTVIFRGTDARATDRVEGVLKPGEMRTGEKSGLFWVPFKNRRRIRAVGLRDIEVIRQRTDESIGG